jgi:hypothetical protein
MVRAKWKVFSVPFGKISQRVVMIVRSLKTFLNILADQTDLGQGREIMIAEEVQAFSTLIARKEILD